MISRKLIARLLFAVVVLPIAMCVTWGVGHLLDAMGDAEWARVLYRTCLLGGILWGVGLVCLLVALGVHTVAPTDDSPNSSDD